VRLQPALETERGVEADVAAAEDQDAHRPKILPRECAALRWMQASREVWSAPFVRDPDRGAW
jgi:hypothetical protein